MPEHISMGTVWLTLDLAGAAVFAVSGAAVGVKHRLDVFGVSVLAFVAGNAGGMRRTHELSAAGAFTRHASTCAASYKPMRENDLTFARGGLTFCRPSPDGPAEVSVSSRTSSFRQKPRRRPSPGAW